MVLSSYLLTNSSIGSCDTRQAERNEHYTKAVKSFEQVRICNLSFIESICTYTYTYIRKLELTVNGRDHL